MTRKSKREIERAVEDLTVESADSDVGEAIEHDLDEETEQLMDDLTTPDDVYGPTPDGWKRIHEEFHGEKS